MAYAVNGERVPMARHGNEISAHIKSSSLSAITQDVVNVREHCQSCVYDAIYRNTNSANVPSANRTLLSIVDTLWSLNIDNYIKIGNIEDDRQRGMWRHMRVMCVSVVGRVWCSTNETLNYRN